jgi:glycerophosphoryl diester phosphodiesterase
MSGKESPYAECRSPIPDPMQMSPPPLILGHRGAPRERPENTIAAFAEALRQGAHGVELDVQCTRDGVPVVIHDDVLERTTDGTGPVSGRTHTELERVRAGGEPVPTLAQAVTWARDAGAILNVEIKAPGVEEATLEALSAGGMLERTILSSFDPGIVRTVGRLSPHCRRYLLSERWDEEMPGAVDAVDAEGLCLRVDAASPLALQVLASLGIPLIVWTVDAPERIRELLGAGVRGIITNTPATAVRIAEELGLLREDAWSREISP